MNRNDEKYWLNRAIIHDKKMEKDIKKIEKELKKLLTDTSKDIKKELAFFYANNNGLSEYEKYRLESTLQSIYNALDKIYHKEEELLNKHLIQSYIDTYEYYSKSLTTEVAFNAINQTVVQQAILTNWSGLTFSERIWENRRRLALSIKQELTSGLTRGESLQSMARILSKKLNVSYSDAKRLVHTETTWVQTEATKKSYEDNDIGEYEISAFLDKKTSDICKELDGKVIKIKDGIVGKTLPPFHPHCRTVILPVIKD